MAEQTTASASLDTAAKAITSLLSGKPEETQSEETQSEQSTAPAPETEQTPAAPDEESSESEQAESEGAESAETDPSQPRSFKVKVNGQEIEVTEDEVLKGYSRTEDYTRKTQQLAEQRKQFEEQEVAAVRAERHQYGQYLDQLKTALTQITPAEPDWAALKAQVTPDIFAAELLNWKQNQDRIAKVDAERAKVTAQQEADAQRGFQQHVQAEQAKLEAALPDMKDPEKAKTLKADLAAFAQAKGFTPDELQSVTDHRVVLLLHAAMQHEQGKAKAVKVENKITKALEVSAPGSRTSVPKTDALKDAKARLRQSGRVEDAADALNAIFNKKAS